MKAKEACRLRQKREWRHDHVAEAETGKSRVRRKVKEAELCRRRKRQFAIEMAIECGKNRKKVLVEEDESREKCLWGEAKCSERCW